MRQLGPTVGLIGASVLLGCGLSVPEDATQTPATSQQILVSRLGFGRPYEDGSSPGFDLDGLASEEGDSAGCGVEDYPAADGGFGVDNGIAPILQVLDLTEAIAVETLVQGEINAGSLLILFDLNEVDDWQQDEAVTLSLVRGSGVPLVGTDGLPVDGQTFDRDSSIAPVPAREAWIEDGLLRASGLSVAVPLQVFDFVTAVELLDVELGLPLEGGPGTGHLAGTLDWRPLVEDLLAEDRIDRRVRELLEPLFSGASDMGPDCTLISVVMEFEGASAWLYE